MKVCNSCNAALEDTHSFCPNCGAAKPVVTSWKCTCGNVNQGKFCSQCGSKKPGGYQCDKCGWKPEEGAALPKFCPECGDRFDSNDTV